MLCVRQGNGDNWHAKYSDCHVSAPLPYADQERPWGLSAILLCAGMTQRVARRLSTKPTHSFLLSTINTTAVSNTKTKTRNEKLELSRNTIATANSFPPTGTVPREIAQESSPSPLPVQRALPSWIQQRQTAPHQIIGEVLPMRRCPFASTAILCWYVMFSDTAVACPV